MMETFHKATKEGLRQGNDLLVDEVDHEWVRIIDEDRLKALRKPLELALSLVLFFV